MDLATQLALLRAPVPGRGRIVLGGRPVAVPGTFVTSFRDGSPCAPPLQVNITARRDVPPQFVVAHTVTGQPHDPPFVPGFPDATRACNYTRAQASTSREASYDFLVSTVGWVLQQIDPWFHYSWNAGTLNGRAFGGIEVEQGPGGAVYGPSVRAFVALVDTLTLRAPVPIQRQIPAVVRQGRRVPDRRLLARFEAPQDGRDWWGVVGHRNATIQRGPGDPGDVLLQALLDAGYEGWDVAAGEDLDVWAARQRVLGVATTGTPGPETVAALRARGRRSGILVWRPGDPV